jgi:photosystem II stability/assembly factor-like uncharacterized protein
MKNQRNNARNVGRLALALFGLVIGFAVPLASTTGQASVQRLSPASTSNSYNQENPLSLNRWSSNGPEGGPVSALAIDPDNTATIYAGTNSGVFKSTNGGESWSSLTISASALAIDPITPTILYANANGVSKSTDGGASWHTINNGMANQYGNVLSGSKLAIDPGTPTTVYVGTSGRGMFKTTDGGTMWNPINNGLPIDPWGNTNVGALAIDPTNPNVIYASVGVNIPNSSAYFPAIFKSTNGGANWSQIFNGLRVIYSLTLLVIDPVNPNTIYAGGYSYDCCGGVVLKSTNSGGSWSQSHPSGAVSVEVLAIDPTNPNIVYLGSGGLLKSTNGGQSWTDLDSGFTKLGVRALAIDPNNPSSIYAGTLAGGAFKSRDGGVNWSATNKGLRAVNVERLAVDPTNSQMIYIYAENLGYVIGAEYKSADNGGSWSANDFYPLAFDHTRPNTIYASVTGHYGLSKSTDGGATWSSANTGLENNSVSTLAIDPNNSEVIYAGTGGRLFKTTNGGESWSAIGNLLCPELLAIDPHNSQTLYAVASYDCYDYCTTVYKSTDGGVNWIRSDSGTSFYYVSALVIDPINTQTIYVSDNEGMAKSTDGGGSWNAVIRQPGASSVSSVVADPVRPSVIYAGTNGDGVFRSADAGASWKQLNDGLTNLNINTLAIDPSGNFLHAGSRMGVFDIQLSIPPQPNPIDDAQFFVRQHYLDFLNREPDAGGLAYWTNEITKCNADARCIHERRIGVSAAFFVEMEFQDTGYYVYRFYKGSFGRQPNYTEFTSDRSKVIGGPNLEANKQAFADEWVQRAAFTQAYPITMSNTEFVNKLFNSAGLAASLYDAQRQQEIERLNAGVSRALVLRDVIEIPDFKNIPDRNDPRYAGIKQTSQYNPAFVLMQYFGYLRRDVDRDGYDFWLDVVNNREPNNYHGMVCAFITSTEYQLRFGSTVTRSNADCAQ